MSGKKRLIYLGTFILISIAVLSPLSLPAPKSSDSVKFSAERAASNIEYISKEPHSIEHPQARAKVRDYIASRVSGMGLTPHYHHYDSVINRFGDAMDIANLYTKVEPLDGTSDSYILFVAHMDSRFKTKVKDRYVYSYGAADDGYGVAIILELMNNLLKNRNEWKQGVKILFTDSEESGLEGMKSALKYDAHVFENVNLVVNIEARGVRGPALLFETSPGNSKLMELYKEAKHPYTYSMTSVIYNILPNSTDFSCVSKDIPGFNFSVIDNLNYYHTDLDNYDNISLRSIQHYGEQILPITRSYLVNSSYGDMKAFDSDEDLFFFTVPHIGMFSFKNSLLITMLYISLAAILLSILLFIAQRRASIKKILKITAINLLLLIVGAAAGYGISQLLAYISGVEFNPVNLTYIEGEYIIVLSVLLLLYIAYTAIYRRFIKGGRSYSNIDFLSSGALLITAVSIASFYVLGDATLFWLPAVVSSLALLLNLFTFYRYTNYIGWSVNLLYLLPLFYCLVMAVTIGALMLFIPLFLLYIAIQVPLSRQSYR